MGFQVFGLGFVFQGDDPDASCRFCHKVFYGACVEEFSFFHNREPGAGGGQIFYYVSGEKDGAVFRKIYQKISDTDPFLRRA